MTLTVITKITIILKINLLKLKTFKSSLNDKLIILKQIHLHNQPNLREYKNKTNVQWA